MKRVYISKDLDVRSPFRAKLEDLGYEIIAQSMLRHRPVDFDVPELADWLFFYSPGSVHFFLETVKSIPQNYQLAVMSITTAEILNEAGLEAQFVGKGEPEEVGRAFLKLAKGKHVIFVQSRKADRHIQIQLDGQIQISDLTVYENLPRGDVNIPPCDVYVFTSPMDVRNYFDRFLFPNGKVVFSVGPSTTHSLKIYGLTEVLQVESSNELELARAVLKGLHEFQ